MQRALSLARGGLGRVWPNPSVGCVIVNDGEVVGEGATQPGGRPHAEVVALKDAGEAARGATAYVSLEPCAHFGKTPPCADAMIAAGIVHCVVAIIDPDPRVNGKGLKKLEAAGVTTELGLFAEEARAINEGFFLRIETGRPLVAACPAGDIEKHRENYDAVLHSDPSGEGIWAEVRGTGLTSVRWWLGKEAPLGSQAWRKFTTDLEENGCMKPLAILESLAQQGITRVVLADRDPLFLALKDSQCVDHQLSPLPSV